MQQTAAQAAGGRAPFRRGAAEDRPKNGALRRKLARGRPADRDRPAQAAQCWRLALARAARDAAGLELAVDRIEVACRSLHEVIELLPERALLVLLRGPQRRLGMMALSPEVTASLIESQTIGRVRQGAAPPRRPTRIDAAMVAGWIQRALSGLNAGVGPGADEAWARGYHYDSFVDNARAMELLLEERPHRALIARLSLADGAREGTALLVLPETDEADGARPGTAREPAGQAVAPAPAADFTAALAQGILEADCLLDAVLARASVPLSTVLGLRAGLVLPLGNVTLDAVCLEDINGRMVARARLGQQGGLRAVRVNPQDTQERAAPLAAEAVLPEAAWPEAGRSSDDGDRDAGATGRETAGPDVTGPGAMDPDAMDLGSMDLGAMDPDAMDLLAAG